MLASKVPRSIASATPASPASSPDSSHAALMTRVVGIPTLRASPASSEVARMALPSLVYRNSRCRPSRLATASPMMTSCRGEKTMPRMCTGRSGGSW